MEWCGRILQEQGQLFVFLDFLTKRQEDEAGRWVCGWGRTEGCKEKHHNFFFSFQIQSEPLRQPVGPISELVI